ncbi:MAG: serine/threonine protein kinase, partial [Sorangiineae bacterium PRO1]|nr:serine/threonine protein kinase [Sorangiineae bacterium PRO1]
MRRSVPEPAGRRPPKRSSAPARPASARARGPVARGSPGWRGSSRSPRAGEPARR